jgi:hypothetical protein
MKKMNKRGVFDQLGALGVGIATLVITLSVVFLILANVGSNAQVAADPNASLAVDTMTAAAADIPGWVPLVVIVAIGGLILAMISIFRR